MLRDTNPSARQGYSGGFRRRFGFVGCVLVGVVVVVSLALCMQFDEASQPPHNSKTDLGRQNPTQNLPSQLVALLYVVVCRCRVGLFVLAGMWIVH